MVHESDSLIGWRVGVVVIGDERRKGDVSETKASKNKSRRMLLKTSMKSIDAF